MIKFLHAADLHLDSAFAGLSPELSALCRKKQRLLAEELVQRCNDLGCDLLLLAGDIFDKEPGPEALSAFRNALTQCRSKVFIAPGNHDPYTDRSPWATLSWPDHVHIFSGDMTCVPLPELGCRIWGAAFRDREAAQLLRPIPKTRDGFLEIGLFHGDPVNRSSYHDIPPETLDACGLDYLALGHIHKGFGPQKRGKTFYGWPGAAMGRGFDECGKKGVLHICLEPGQCRSTFLPLSAPVYEVLTLPADSLLLPPDTEQTICRLILTGESDPVDIPVLHKTLAPRFLHLEIRDETTSPRNLWETCGCQTLRGIALAHLKDQYDRAETPEEQECLETAARYVLAALEGRDEP